ncbi:hypothetical protein SAMN05443550_104366 [Pedobacter hartonius]|uniref:Uncharacterized protein n=1 Tax=Pedobacter hartonius TaxID=425514 RepID=A0A1H4D8L0_9SPHI|nr:hypothetical protein SAMN05443550_104366 [Pedobacter hartonius]
MYDYNKLPRFYTFHIFSQSNKPKDPISVKL